MELVSLFTVTLTVLCWHPHLPFFLLVSRLKHFASLFTSVRPLQTLYFPFPLTHLAKSCSLQRGAKCFSLTFNMNPQRDIGVEENCPSTDSTQTVWRQAHTSDAHCLFMYTFPQACVCLWVFVLLMRIPVLLSLAAGSSQPFIALSVLMLPCVTKQP